MKRTLLSLLFVLATLVTSEAKTIQLPAFGVVEAVQKAQRFVQEQKIDISHYFVVSAEYKNLHNEYERGFWEVIWALQAGATEPRIILRVTQDGSVTVVSSSGVSAKSDDLTEVFSPSFVPVMQGLETTSIQTTLRGFTLRADSFPGIKQKEPTAYGMLLNVAIADAGPKAERIDKNEQKDGCTCRTVQIPPRVAGEDSIEVVFSYGKEVPKSVVSVVSTCIDKLLHDHPPA